ncbi:hypothetical protein [Bdellovibrio sp. HCB209]|uniref:hypothetical protein n=1 Tax=Bdellovibrio sp. HCB209 TaxID=3394354 RepID=UPI0039B67042
MLKQSIRGVLTLSILLASQASFAGLSLKQVEECISNEMELVRVVPPLKAEFLHLERQGSVAEIINMLKSNSEDLEMLDAKELAGSHGKALQKEIGELNAVLEESKTCQEARTSMLKFANVYDKRPLLSLSVFFEKDEHNVSELAEWNAGAKESLKAAGYSKALASFNAEQQPGLSLLLVSGETTSVLNEQFVLGRDNTMRSALIAIVGDDAPAGVLERRLAEKMRKESLKKMEDTLRSAREFVRR